MNITKNELGEVFVYGKKVTKNEYGEIEFYGHTRSECESNIKHYETQYERYGDESYKWELEHWEQNLNQIEEIEKYF
jgi:hypothetical protein